MKVRLKEACGRKRGREEVKTRRGEEAQLARPTDPL